ncbi:MAG: flagellar hook-basal body complex protein FliE [Treponema sp.]|nr:flagellar hook-basal body complex protein FliE [Treponema sp.]
MSLINPTLFNLGNVQEMALRITHPDHRQTGREQFQAQGQGMIETGRTLGADMSIRSGTFSEAMLHALDQVSAYQQIASATNQAALLDPDSINVEDVTMAQAQASISLNITRNVLNRLVQGWRDLINTR